MIICRVYLKYVQRRKDKHTLGDDAATKAEQENIDTEQEMVTTTQS